MDAKFGTIYCTISDVRIILYFQLQVPPNFTDCNETYADIKEQMEIYKTQNFKFFS